MSVVKTVLVKESDSSPVYIYPRTSADIVEYDNETIKDKLDRIKADVPADAKFTDTTYENATQITDGLMSKEDKSNIDRYLKIPQSQDDIGLITYQEKQKIDNLHNSDGITDGLMSVSQYNKLNGIQSEATKTIVDQTITQSSDNPVSSKSIYNALNQKANIDHTHNINQLNISYTDISGKQAIEVENLNSCINTGLYYQTTDLILNNSSNITVSKGQYICQVLSDISESSQIGNVFQTVYIYSGSYSFYTYARSIKITNESTTVGNWICTQIGILNDNNSSGTALTSGILKSISLDNNTAKFTMFDESIKSLDLSNITLSQSQKDTLNSIPADAKFTDTTYENASQITDGLMSKEDKSNIDSISNNSYNNIKNFRNYVHLVYGDNNSILSEDYFDPTEISIYNNSNNVSSITADNTKFTVSSSSIFQAMVSNKICHIHIRLVLTSTNSSLNVLPVIELWNKDQNDNIYFPFKVYSARASMHCETLFSVKSTATIKRGRSASIVKPELILNSDYSRLFWGYTDSDNKLCTKYDYTNGNSKSCVLYTDSNNITIYIDGTIFYDKENYEFDTGII